MSIKKPLTKAALSTAMSYISGDPEKNLPKRCLKLRPFKTKEHYARGEYYVGY